VGAFRLHRRIQFALFVVYFPGIERELHEYEGRKLLPSCKYGFDLSTKFVLLASLELKVGIHRILQAMEEDQKDIETLGWS